MGSPGRVTVVMLVGYLLAAVAAPAWHHHDHRPCDVPPSIGEHSGVAHECALGDHGAGHCSTSDGHTPHDRRQDRPAPMPCPSDDDCLVCQCIAQSALPVVAPMAQQLLAPLKSIVPCPVSHKTQTAVSLPLSRAPPVET